MFCLTGKLTSACCSKSKANLLPLPLIRSYLLPHGCCRSVPFLPPLANKQTGARLTSEWRRRGLSPLEVQDGRESVGRRCFSSARTLPFAGVCTAAYLADTHTRPANLSALQVDTGACGKAPERGVLSLRLHKLPLITAEGFCL